jgi:hypothetical protein
MPLTEQELAAIRERISTRTMTEAVNHNYYSLDALLDSHAALQEENARLRGVLGRVRELLLSSRWQENHYRMSASDMAIIGMEIKKAITPPEPVQ